MATKTNIKSNPLTSFKVQRGRHADPKVRHLLSEDWGGTHLFCPGAGMIGNRSEKRERRKEGERDTRHLPGASMYMWQQQIQATIKHVYRYLTTTRARIILGSIKRFLMCIFETAIPDELLFSWGWLQILLKPCGSGSLRRVKLGIPSRAKWTHSTCNGRHLRLRLRRSLQVATPARNA